MLSEVISKISALAGSHQVTDETRSLDGYEALKLSKSALVVFGRKGFWTPVEEWLLLGYVTWVGP